MPNVFLMTRAEAEAALSRAGFDRAPNIDTSLCGSVTERKVVELGRVCYQSPAAGRPTGSRSPASIRVQTENPWAGELGGGRRWFLMPDLIGTHVDKAKVTVRQLGFTEKEVMVSYVDEPGCKPNMVCKTYPEGMTRTDNTSDKLFYVGRPLETPKPTPTVTTPTTPTTPTPTTPTPTTPTTPTKPSLGDAF